MTSKQHPSETEIDRLVKQLKEQFFCGSLCIEVIQALQSQQKELGELTLAFDEQHAESCKTEDSLDEAVEVIKIYTTPYRDTQHAKAFLSKHKGEGDE